MPDYTFFLDADSGKMMIHKYEPNYTVDDLKADVAIPSYEGEVTFHSDFTFITVIGTAYIASATLPSFTRDTHTWSDGGKCFITTAAVEIMGMGDNDNVLETLRSFRDGYMQQTDEMKALVDEYYEIAPSIVKAIDETQNPIEVYSNIFTKYIVPSKQYIDKGENEKALATYKEMVEYTKSFLGE